MDSHGDQEPRTIIAETSKLEGKLTSVGPVHVSGRIEGQLFATSLVISETGSVHGEVNVESLDSHGELSGQIKAERVTLAGNVRDNTSISAASLEVKLTSDDSGTRHTVTFGTSHVEVGDHEAVKPRETTAAPPDAASTAPEEAEEDEEDLLLDPDLDDELE